MTAFLIVAATWLTPFALIGAWVLADRWLDGRADDKRLVADPAWIADLSEPTPIYDALACEHMERAEGWSE